MKKICIRKVQQTKNQVFVFFFKLIIKLREVEGKQMRKMDEKINENCMEKCTTGGINRVLILFSQVSCANSIT